MFIPVTKLEKHLFHNLSSTLWDWVYENRQLQCILEEANEYVRKMEADLEEAQKDELEELKSEKNDLENEVESHKEEYDELDMQFNNKLVEIEEALEGLKKQFKTFTPSTFNDAIDNLIEILNADDEE